MAIQLFKLLEGPWDRVRGYLREDLEQLEIAINLQQAATDTSITVIEGDVVTVTADLSTEIAARIASDSALQAEITALDAAAVKQSGVVTIGHLATWASDHLIQDGGPVPSGGSGDITDAFFLGGL